MKTYKVTTVFKPLKNRMKKKIALPGLFNITSFYEII